CEGTTFSKALELRRDVVEAGIRSDGGTTQIEAVAEVATGSPDVGVGRGRDSIGNDADRGRPRRRAVQDRIADGCRHIELTRIVGAVDTNLEAVGVHGAAVPVEVAFVLDVATTDTEHEVLTDREVNTARGQPLFALVTGRIGSGIAVDVFL